MTGEFTEICNVAPWCFRFSHHIFQVPFESQQVAEWMQNALKTENKINKRALPLKSDGSTHEIKDCSSEQKNTIECVLRRTNGTNDTNATQ